MNFCPRAVSYFTRSKSVRDLSSRKRERLATEKKGSEFGRTSAHQNSDQVYLPVIDSNKAPRSRNLNQKVTNPRPNHKSYMQQVDVPLLHAKLLLMCPRACSHKRLNNLQNNAPVVFGSRTQPTVEMVVHTGIEIKRYI